MKRLANKTAALLLAVWLLAGLTVPAAWAAPAGEITISSAEELLDFAKNCSLDTWSQGKTVRLTADIDLSGRAFSPIPTFGGTFLGDGHTISGLRVSASGSNMGLFRYLQAGAVVQDLHVSGNVVPNGSASSVGGIAGCNAGSVQNCSFRGTVKGDASVGGIAGRNEAQGEIAGCSVSGDILGQSRTGGVAGQNSGILLKCESSANVNITYSDPSSTNLEKLSSGETLDQLTTGRGDDADSLLNSHTDTGGIVGYSSGVVQSCVNSGAVGYPHVGYNVGGVAGRQTGYLAGCSNSGDVYGRKDVGGVVGQAEPYLILSPGSDTLERLRTELDTLDSLINRTLDHTDSSGDEISACLTSISGFADAAKDSSKVLLDHTSDFIDGNIQSLNSLSASVTNALDDLSPALDDLSAVADHLEALFDRLKDALDTLADAADLGEDALTDIKNAVSDLRLSGEGLKDAAQAMRKAAEALQSAIIVKDQAAVNQAVADLSRAMADLGAAHSRAAEALSRLREALRGSVPNDDAITSSLQELTDSLTVMGDSLRKATKALGSLAKNTEIDWAALQEVLPDLRAALQELRRAAGQLPDFLSGLQAALRDAGALSGKLKDAMKDLGDVTSLAAGVSRRLSSAFDTLHDVTDRLAEDGPIEFTPLGQDVRDASDALYGSLSDLSGELKTLQASIDGARELLSSDLRAISRQLNKVFDLLLDALTDLQNGSGSDMDDLIEDTSDEDIAATRQGKITGCRNTGAVDGDRNAGGIVGAMSVELDLDPEDDSTQFSFGSTYETKAVLQDSVNHGTVTVKKDCAGGLVGHMDLGTVLGCQNYGDVTSTSGSYVGGIAGSADASVRNSYAKCVLSGTNYIGGIAGWGSRLTGCYAIVTVADGTECVGAVAGDADLDSGNVRNNGFVDTGTAGIDGISYAGIAEPVDFEHLRQMPGIPTEFISFTLTLTANDAPVAQIPFYYGEDLSLVELPEVPEQEGYYGSWPEFDTSGLHSDITLEAVYTPWVTLVASEAQEGKLALALAEGQFTEETLLTVRDSDQAPPSAALEREADVWEISLTGSDLTENDAVPLRLLNRGGGKAAVWQLVDGQWQSVEAAANGHYLLLTMEGTSGTFCICSAGNSLLPLFLLAAVILILLICLVGKRIRKKKNAASVKAAAAHA